jgi:hypothetical protein
MSGFRAPKTVFGGLLPGRAGWGMAKIELPEGWAGVAEPLRALMAQIERVAQQDEAVSPPVLPTTWADAGIEELPAEQGDRDGPVVNRKATHRKLGIDSSLQLLSLAVGVE